MGYPILEQEAALGIDANNYINLSIKSLSREILGLVSAARTTSLSIVNSERAEIVLAEQPRLNEMS